MVGYLVKTLWNIEKLMRSSRFQNNKHQTFLLKKNTTFPEFSLTFYVFSSLVDRLPWLGWNSDSHMNASSVVQDETISLFSALHPICQPASLLQFLLHFVPLSSQEFVTLTLCIQVIHWTPLLSFLCTRHCLGSGNKALNVTDKQVLPLQSVV